MGEALRHSSGWAPAASGDAAAREGRLPDGVRLLPLSGHRDHRGILAEIFRAAWIGNDAGPFLQWNAVASEPGVLRGVHVHARHTDYLVVLAGEALIGLHDMRPHSSTAGLSRLLPASEAAWQGVVVPPGVAHGIFFRARSLLLYGFDSYWDPADDIGCHWADPELGLDWPAATPTLSERDATAGDYASLKAALAAAMADGMRD